MLYLHPAIPCFEEEPHAGRHVRLPDLGHRTLQALLDSEHDVVLVVTHPKSEHAYEKIWSDSVADLAEAHGVPVLIRNRPDDDELFQRLKEADPDIIVANNWRTWIPRASSICPAAAR
ncbi:hypothetical protein SSPO_007970 [Streptomyces antimycoticus]|uniref:Uncharacterized protein n=1 Tax=Streptomyces antimycoticus TaxID=68175 RepID=A0A499ULR4_9ACTN|nr:hypothetical protein SSPO_007970 [Streptomyces antimycoticus]